MAGEELAGKYADQMKSGRRENKGELMQRILEDVWEGKLDASAAVGIMLYAPIKEGSGGLETVRILKELSSLNSKDKDPTSSEWESAKVRLTQLSFLDVGQDRAVSLAALDALASLSTTPGDKDRLSDKLEEQARNKSIAPEDCKSALHILATRMEDRVERLSELSRDKDIGKYVQDSAIRELSDLAKQGANEFKNKNTEFPVTKNEVQNILPALKSAGTPEAMSTLATIAKNASDPALRNHANDLLGVQPQAGAKQRQKQL